MIVEGSPVVVTGKSVWEMSAVMSKNVPFLMVMVAILIVLIVLFLSFGHEKHKREEELARLTGKDEHTRYIRLELEEYRNTNRNQQLGISAVGFVIVLVAVVWWVAQPKREPK